VKLLVHVRMFPDAIAAVDACAAALSQQSYGAAFSRAEALRIVALEWLKERQARQAGGTPASPQRAPRRVKKLEAGLTAEFPTPPSPKLRLACCSLYHAYSVPSEGGSGGEDKAYGLEDIARIYHRDCRSSIAVA
jgi:hypothetical protein